MEYIIGYGPLTTREDTLPEPGKLFLRILLNEKSVTRTSNQTKDGTHLVKAIHVRLGDNQDFNLIDDLIYIDDLVYTSGSFVFEAWANHSPSEDKGYRCDRIDIGHRSLRQYGLRQNFLDALYFAREKSSTDIVLDWNLSHSYIDLTVEKLSEEVRDTQRFTDTLARRIGNNLQDYSKPASSTFGYTSECIQTTCSDCGQEMTWHNGQLSCSKCYPDRE